MRVLKENEIQAVSGGRTLPENVQLIGGLLIGEGAPTGFKSIVGTLAMPFVLILGYVIGAHSG